MWEIQANEDCAGSRYFFCAVDIDDAVLVGSQRNSACEFLARATSEPMDDIVAGRSFHLEVGDIVLFDRSCTC